MNGIHEKLFGIFQAEHAEHLQQIRSILALLEQTGGSALGPQIDEAFRRAHTLKGAARAVDIRPVEGLAHHLETLFTRVREGKLEMNGAVSGVVHQVLDASEDCMAGWGRERTSRQSSQPDDALRAIEALLGLKPELPAAVAESAASPAPVAAVAEFQPVETLRVSGQDLDRVLRSAGQILMETNRQKTVNAQVRETARQTAELTRDWERTRKASGDSWRGAKLDRGASRSMEALDRRVRTLTGQARQTQLAHQRSAWNLHQLAVQLQQDAWRARLTPAWGLAEGFGKMVRDLARDEKKEIAFRVTGGDIHADRLVLQSLKDPIMHLLRNAVSHGLETAEERTASGKAPAGSLTLDMISERQRLIVTVADDGRGVDLNRVAEVAVQKGLLTPAAVAASSPGEIALVIFRPGFSTAREVTSLSGRGMGLSVVYETVRRLQGEVEIRRREGPGAAIVVSVPLSLSACHLVLFVCSGQTFGIPSHGIACLYRVGRKQVEQIQGKPAVLLAGRQQPLFSLAHLLGIHHSTEALINADVLNIVLLRAGTRLAAIVVDSFVAEKDGLIQDLGIPSMHLGNVTGGVLLEDGAIALTLNPLNLLDACANSNAPFLDHKPAAPQLPASILVVDDSITTRSLEKGILEAHGYHVRVAVDGIEALELLRAEMADLVVTDVQMPRLDGFGLLEAMKADRRLSAIPVIVVTSLERKEDQDRGMTLGAEAYIVKRKFDQRELLDAIRQML